MSTWTTEYKIVVSPSRRRSSRQYEVDIYSRFFKEDSSPWRLEWTHEEGRTGFVSARGALRHGKRLIRAIKHAEGAKDARVIIGEEEDENT